MLKHPKTAKRLHCAQRGLSRRNTQGASGNKISNPSVHRSKLSVMGEIRGATMRPTTALPDHSNGGNVKSMMALRLRRVPFGVFIGRM